MGCERLIPALYPTPRTGLTRTIVRAAKLLRGLETVHAVRCFRLVGRQVRRQRAFLRGVGRKDISAVGPLSVAEATVNRFGAGVEGCVHDAFL